MKKTIALLLAGLTGAGSAFAWGPGGHMMIAYIAYARLGANAKAAVDKLISIQIDPAPVTSNSLDFVNASHWPDDLRSKPWEAQFADSFPLHFADYPFTIDGTALPADLPAPNNVVTALTSYLNILKTSTDDNARAQALRFIIHFVGDVHQPLHCSAEVTQANPHGDEGGNLFSIKVGRSNVKLHSYWDGGIGNFPKGGPAPDYAPPPLSQIPDAAQAILALTPDSAAWNTGAENFSGWAQESSALAQSVAYKNIQPGKQPSAAYNKLALSTAQHQVAFAGYRLAALLNSLWPTPAP